MAAVSRLLVGVGTGGAVGQPDDASVPRITRLAIVVGENFARISEGVNGFVFISESLSG